MSKLPTLRLVVSAAFFFWSHVVWASPSVYVLAIGYNGAPAPAAGGAANEAQLRYADDDAAAFYQFAREFSRDARLLTVMDADTQARFPAEVAEARPPTLTELHAEVRRLRRALDAERQKGGETVVLIFYSGHGSRPTSAPASLTLLDGALTRETLYSEVLSELPATYIHLLVDACYAEAIVRPRDAEATTVDLSESDIAHYASHATLARFPNVGAMIAASTSSQTHEWDAYRHGVFTHELVSGLRGGADVNGDGRIEYSELYAFLAAANRAVSDARARLSVVARPPTANLRVPILDLGAFRSPARITGISASAGEVYLEDQFGNRLADIRVEAGAHLGLTLPANRRIYVRSREGDAELFLRDAQALAFDQVKLEPPAARTRGAQDLAMKRGLFSTGFGPNYYRGFIDQSPDFVAVPLPDGDATTGNATTPSPDVAGSDAKLPASGSRALHVAGGVAEGVGRGLGPMIALRVGLVPAETSGFIIGVDGAWRQSSAFTEWRALGSAGYQLGFRRGRAGGFLAGSVGGGIVSQSLASSALAGAEISWTGALTVTPAAGISYRFMHRTSVRSEAAAAALVYRRDGVLAASLLPAAYLGFTVDL